MAAKEVPEHVLEDEQFCRDMIIAVGEAVAKSMDQSEWKKFAIRFDLADKTTDRHRFLRSLSFDDPDHEGMVIELVQDVFYANQNAFFDLFERPGVQLRLKRSYPQLLEKWGAKEDPLIDALAHSVDAVDAVSSVIDLKLYTTRIQNALPGDPHAAVGHTKDMLEATMRTIMDRRGKAVDKNTDFRTLTTLCMSELGLIHNTAPTSDQEKYVRKIASAAKTMIETANEFRNAAGSGHGHVVGKQIDVTPADASMVASNALILAAWILKRHADKG